METVKIRSELKDGSQWAEHEDCIIGNEEGLRNLISACEAAIKDKSSYGSKLGDYVGIKCLPTEWFDEPNNSPEKKYSNQILGIVFIVVAGCALIGLFTAIKWIFGLTT